MKDDFSEPAVSGQTRFIKKVFLLDSDQYLKDRKDKNGLEADLVYKEEVINISKKTR